MFLSLSVEAKLARAVREGEPGWCCNCKVNNPGIWCRSISRLSLTLQPVCARRWIYKDHVPESCHFEDFADGRWAGSQIWVNEIVYTKSFQVYRMIIHRHFPIEFFPVHGWRD